MIRIETEPIISAQMRLKEQRRIIFEEPDWFSSSEKTRIYGQTFISTKTHRSLLPLRLERTLVISDRVRIPWFPKKVWQQGDLSHRAPSHG